MEGLESMFVFLLSANFEGVKYDFLFGILNLFNLMEIRYFAGLSKSYKYAGLILHY